MRSLSCHFLLYLLKTSLCPQIKGMINNNSNHKENTWQVENEKCSIPGFWVFWFFFGVCVCVFRNENLIGNGRTDFYKRDSTLDH